MSPPHIRGREGDLRDRTAPRRHAETRPTRRHASLRGGIIAALVALVTAVIPTTAGADRAFDTAVRERRPVRRDHTAAVVL